MIYTGQHKNQEPDRNAVQFMKVIFIIKIQLISLR